MSARARAASRANVVRMAAARTPRMTPPRPAKGGRKPAAGLTAPPPGMFAPGGMGGGLDEMFAPTIGPTEAISAWLEKTYQRGPVSSLRLCQKSPEGESAVTDWDAEELQGQEPDSIAEMIYSRAVEDASGLDRIGRYVILAYRDPAKPYVARHFFRVANEDQDGVFESEGANATGLVSQAHRFAEAYSRALLSGFGDIMRQMNSQMARISEQNESLTGIHVQLIVAQQALLDRSAQRNLETRRETLKMERSERIAQTAEKYIASYAPMLLAHVGFPMPPALAAPGATVGAGAKVPSPIDLAGEELALLHRVSVQVLSVVAGIDEGPFEMLISRVPPESRDLVRRLRAKHRDATEHTIPTDEDKRALLAFRTVVVALLSSLSEMEIGFVTSQLPEGMRHDVMHMRDILRTKLAAASSSATTPRTDSESAAQGA